MKIEKQGDTAKLWLTAEDTYQWARKPGAAWPCSYLSGKTLFAEFYKGDVMDCTIDGEYGYVGMPADEFYAITSDFIKLGELTT